MDEKILSLDKYHKIFDENDDCISPEYLHFSFVPLEIEYLEKLRKSTNIQVSSMRQFCSSLEGIDIIQRVPLIANDIANALTDSDFENEFLSQQMNPYRLSAITVIRHHEYPCWSDDIYDQYREFYE